jgi:uncharacterized protein involved in exopolysaccharide biosynthesis
MSSAAPEKRERDRDVDAEQEIDLGRIWRSVVVRWWLLVVGLVVGAIIGLLVSIGGGKQWKATSQVYLGQPLSPGGTSPISSTSTLLGLATYYAGTEAAIREAAQKSDLPRRKLRGNVSTKAILGLTGTKLGTAAPIVAITVTSSNGAKAAKASNALADLVLGKFNSYSNQKLKTLQAQADRDAKELEQVSARLQSAFAGQQKLLESGISETTKLVALANFNALIAQATANQQTLQTDLSQTQQEIAAVKNVEAPRIVAEARATNTGGPSRRSGVLIGALIGLVIGFLVAILWEPVARTVRSHQSE